MRTVTEIPRPPSRDPDAHKGDFGHVLVLAGSPRMSGAALLATGAALRSGAGLVTLGIPAAIHSHVAPSILCAMTLPLPSSSEGTFSRAAIQPALDFSQRATAVALGPGISTNEETVAFASRVTQRSRVPLVLDADGLNCVAKAPNSLRACQFPRVVTPHPGEAARLLSCQTKDVVADRERAAVELCEKFGSVVVLKGHRTLVTDGDRIYVNGTGNPGMATGGAGDVLTGLIAALLAQGMSPFDAAVLGVHVHGRSGDLAARRTGLMALVASDIVDHLGAAFVSLDGAVPES